MFGCHFPSVSRFSTSADCGVIHNQIFFGFNRICPLSNRCWPLVPPAGHVVLWGIPAFSRDSVALSWYTFVTKLLSFFHGVSMPPHVPPSMLIPRFLLGDTTDALWLSRYQSSKAWSGKGPFPLCILMHCN